MSDDSLLVAIQEAQEHTTPPPSTELETCDRLVYPLLVAAGYSRLDIRSQKHSAGFPDYTLLEGTEHEWYVEAKAWSVDLGMAHEHQAVKYPLIVDRRWALLTNGREWQLFDVRRRNGERLVAMARLQDSEVMCSLLSALTKTSVLDGGLQRFVDNQDASRRTTIRRTLLKSVLSEELANPKSQLVEWIFYVLSDREGLEEITPQDIADCFGPTRGGPARPAPLPEVLVATRSRSNRLHPNAFSKLSENEARFWTGFLAYIVEQGIDTSGWLAIPSQSWMVTDLVDEHRTNFAYSMVNRKPHVDLFISTADQVRNAVIFKSLLADRQEIESEYGSSMRWNEGTKNHHIRAELTRGGPSEPDSVNQAAYPGYVEAMERFRQVLRPRLLHLL